jgi:hypothetical protein
MVHLVYFSSGISLSSSLFEDNTVQHFLHMYAEKYQGKNLPFLALGLITCFIDSMIISTTKFWLWRSAMLLLFTIHKKCRTWRKMNCDVSRKKIRWVRAFRILGIILVLNCSLFALSFFMLELVSNILQVWVCPYSCKVIPKDKT